MFRKSFAAFAVAVAAVAVSTSHEARADYNQSAVICTESSQGFPVCYGTVGESGSDGPSSLAYSAWLPNGGWTEVYDDGDWWVDHNPDGSVTVGFDDLGGGSASYINGPKLPAVPGNYQNKEKPSKASKPVSSKPKHNFAALKSAALSKTGSFVSLTPANAKVVVGQNQTAAPSVDVTFAGTGQCKAFLLVKKDGQLVSSSAQPFSFPAKKPVALPKTPGKYTIELRGGPGCMGLTRSTEVAVQAELVRLPTRRVFGR